jgi:hypothetical protein
MPDDVQRDVDHHGDLRPFQNTGAGVKQMFPQVEQRKTYSFHEKIPSVSASW